MSSSSTSEVVITANAGQLIAELQKENAAWRASAEAASKAGQTKERAGAQAGRGLETAASRLKAFNALQREGKSVTESLYTPQERYNSAIGRLGKLYAEGFIQKKTFQRGVLEQKDALAAVTQESANAAGGITKFIGAASGIGVVLGGIATAAALLRREYENIKSEQKNAAGKQIDAASAQRETLFNFKEDGVTPEMLSKDIETISRRRGARQADLWKTTGGALSTKGRELTYQQGMDVVDIAAQISPQDSTQQASIANAILIQQIKNKGATARQIAGYQFAAQIASPVKDRAAFAQHGAPAIANQQQFGDTPQAAAALYATIGGGFGDTEGRVSATTMTDLSKQLAEKLPNVEGGTMGRLRYLQTAEGARVKKRLLGVFSGKAKGAQGYSKNPAELHGEAKGFMTMVSLIQGELSGLEKTMSEIPALEDSGEYFDQMMKQVEAQVLQRTATLERKQNVIAENVRIKNRKAAEGAIARDSMLNILKATEAPQFVQDIALGAFELDGGVKGGGDAIAAARSRLDARRKQLLNPPTVRSVSAGPGGFSTVSESTHTVTDEERKQAADIETSIQAFDEYSDAAAAADAPAADGAVLPSMRESPKWSDIKERPSTIGKPRNMVLRQVLANAPAMHRESPIEQGHREFVERKRKEREDARRILSDPAANPESLPEMPSTMGGDILSPAQPYGFNRGSMDAPTVGRNRLAGVGNQVVSAASQRNPRQHRSAVISGGFIQAADDMPAPREYPKAAAGPVIRGDDSAAKELERQTKLLELIAKSNQSMDRQQKTSPSVTPPPPRFTTPPSARLGRSQSYTPSGV